MLSPWVQGLRDDMPGRVVADYGGIFRVVIAHGITSRIVRASVPGRWLYQTAQVTDRPYVGDFVAVKLGGPEGFWVAEVLARRTALVRQSVGEVVEEQVMAANIDTVLIFSSLNQPVNVGRLARSLALVWDSGANPVVVLTKADLADDRDRAVRDTGDAAPGVAVVPISVLRRDGLEGLDPYLEPGRTVALLGPSGVGKSTLVNYWLGSPRQRVQSIRDDDGRGRHTTTHRELFQLPQGGLVIDIPGVRELGLWDGGTAMAFEDIAQWGTLCRFSDCEHDKEPGCAVHEAVESGHLSLERLRQYRKMERELAHLDRKRSARAGSEARRVWKQRRREAEPGERAKQGNDHQGS